MSLFFFFVGGIIERSCLIFFLVSVFGRFFGILGGFSFLVLLLRFLN